VSETITTGPVSETVTTSISRSGAPPHRGTLRSPDEGSVAASDASTPEAPAFDLIEDAFFIGDRRIELRKPGAALALTAGRLAQHLAASHPRMLTRRCGRDGPSSAPDPPAIAAE
jgi:hypothetical protein